MTDDGVRNGRRKFLATLSTAAAVGLAGCSGGGGGGGGSGGGDSDGGGSGDSGGSEDTETPTPTETPTATEVPYPDEDHNFIVPYATGGGFDAYARITAPFLEEELPNNPNVVVENVTGGGGVRGVTRAANADPDGTTLTIWDAYQAASQQIGRDVPFDVREMSILGALTQSPNALIAMNDADVSSFADFVDRVDELTFATQGVGTIAHTAVPMLGELTGLFSADDPNFVHYGGTGPALGGLERGESDLFMVGTSTSGAKVVSALDSSMVVCFANEDEEQAQPFTDIAQQFLGDIDMGGDALQTYADLTTFRRFVAGPPDVPDSVLSTQREAFQAIVSSDDRLATYEERGRPIINPGDASQVEDVLGQLFDTLGGDPYSGILSNIFQN
jgi:tripartite-type tricarboxylate transporter receptor subunit TctC